MTKLSYVWCGHLCTIRWEDGIATVRIFGSTTRVTRVSSDNVSPPVYGSTSVISVAASSVLVAPSGVVCDSSLFSLGITVSKNYWHLTVHERRPVCCQSVRRTIGCTDKSKQYYASNTTIGVWAPVVILINSQLIRVTFILKNSAQITPPPPKKKKKKMKKKKKKISI